MRNPQPQQFMAYKMLWYNKAQNEMKLKKEFHFPQKKKEKKEMKLNTINEREI